MNRRLLAATLLGAGIVVDALAASRTAASPTVPRSALASFTAAQAYQGRYEYIQNCAECHGGDLGGQFGPALAGSQSNIPWQTPQAVYSYMTQQMPVGNAGGLKPNEYLDIEAFILQSNGRRASRQRLTLTSIARDSAQLDQH